MAGSAQGGVALSAEEVAKHNKRDDCWVIIHGAAFDVTGGLLSYSQSSSLAHHVTDMWASLDIRTEFMPEVRYIDPARVLVGPELHEANQTLTTHSTPVDLLSSSNMQEEMLRESRGSSIAGIIDCRGEMHSILTDFLSDLWRYTAKHMIPSILL